MSYTTINLSLKLDPIVVGEEIVLEDIYYDYDKWDIRPDAEPALIQLSNLLKANPAIRIELASHTDCRGDEDYNMTLSQKRAQSAVDFLIKSGVDAQRLASRGYGETAPKILCICEVCSDSEHQTKRRTSFKVTDIK